MAKSSGSVRFFLKDAKSESTTPIRAVFNYAYIQFVHYEKKLSINPKFWNKDKQRAKQTREFPAHVEVNATLDEIQNSIEKVYRRFKQNNENKEPTLQQLREVVNIERGKTEENKNKTTTLYSFIETFLENSTGRTNLNTGKFIAPITIRAYRQSFRILKEFADFKGKKFDFNDINSDFYSDFTKYMMNELGLRLNTIGKHQRNLKTFMREAFDKNLTANRDFMKKEFKVTSEKVEDVFLDEEEIELLRKLDLANNKRLEKVRDLFVLGCWLGLRYSDLATLTKDNIVTKNGKSNLVVVTQKTEKKVEIPLLNNSLKLTKKYMKETGSPFPKPYSNQKMNQYIKEICEKIPEFHSDFVTTALIKGERQKIKTPKYTNISTHTARRSFASNMLKRGLPTTLIMKITGHTTEKSFNRYIKLSENDYAEMMRERLEVITNL